ncbi:MAG: hypothetical protein IH612_06290, partial [Desulfofustis sp.]|nr:hypothetical protein [Desulfofustis sp.]
MMKPLPIGTDPSVYLRQLAILRSVVDHPYAREIAERAALPVKIVDDTELATLVTGN